MKFEGYASTTESPYDMGFYQETIKRRAFKKTLSENPDLTLNINHGAGASGLPIARTKAGTLTLEEDQVGLRVSADLDPDDPDVALVARKMGRGDLDGQMSFAFMCVRQTWNSDYTKREITEANINHGDVSIVMQGANPATSSALRSAFGAISSRASVVDRRKMAAIIGQGLVVVEMRSFSLDGMRYDFRATPTCNRCQGDGQIVLQGKMVTCPLCGGDGGSSGNAGSNSDPDDGDENLADGHLYLQRARSMLKLYREPPPRDMRAKYNEKELDGLGAKGHAFKNPDGSYSFPVDDEQDLKNAIRAVGRGNANHKAIRLYIIGRAKAMGLSDLIPDTWDQSDGSLKAA